MNRENLGRLVRQVWVRWARTQPDAKESWLAPWEDLEERMKEVDRQIGETLAAEVLGEDWTPGKPTEPGYYWIVQVSRGKVFGPEVARIYDGYPNGEGPPSVLKGNDPWWDKVRDMGPFLRIRTLAGIGAGDKELRSYAVDFHRPLPRPQPPRV